MRQLLLCSLAIVAATLLDGCHGTQPADVVLGDSFVGTPSTTSSEDLLYISGGGELYVYAYPTLGLVKSFFVFNYPSGLCSDKNGNIFVTQFVKYESGNGQILEYQHDGNQPIATFDFPNARPFGCAVDPTTGRLAVTNYVGQEPGEHGSLGVFKESGRIRVFADSTLFFYNFCAYDSSGNLFVDGQDAYLNLVVAELPKGHSSLINLELRGIPKSFGYPAGLVWDGKHLALGDLDSSIIYRLQVSRATATVVGSARLRGGKGVAQFTIAAYPKGSLGLVVIGPNSNDRSVNLWPYPSGGKPVEDIAGLDGSFGSAISVAQPKP